MVTFTALPVNPSLNPGLTSAGGRVGQPSSSGAPPPIRSPGLPSHRGGFAHIASLQASAAPPPSSRSLRRGHRGSATSSAANPPLGHSLRSISTASAANPPLGHSLRSSATSSAAAPPLGKSLRTSSTASAAPPPKESRGLCSRPPPIRRRSWPIGRCQAVGPAGGRRQQVVCQVAATGGRASASEAEALAVGVGGGEEEELGFAGGLVSDVRTKLPHFWSDFADGLHPKVAATTCFLAFACLAPCIAFGSLTAMLTGGAIGVVETIVGTAVSGVVFALLAGQPLTLLGPTGLVVVFTGLLYKVTEGAGLPFLPVYAWVGLWSAAFLLALALGNACRLIGLFTRFTDETFSALISLGFISEAGKSLGRAFAGGSALPADAALLSLLLAVGTCVLALALTRLRSTRLLWRGAREALADFGVPLAIAVASAAPVLLLPQVVLPSLAVPTSFSTTSGRPWLVPLLGVLPPWVIAATMVPAALITALIFLDQNITTRLVNSPGCALRKGHGYHLDLAVLALLVALCSVCGMPWMVASTVPSLSHVQGLATRSRSVSAAGGNAEFPAEATHGVIETRLSGLAIHTLLGCCLLALPLLRLVPLPVMDGLFLYMGLTSLAGNQFVERLKLWALDPELYPEHEFTSGVPPSVTHSFTAFQLSCLVALWWLKHSRFGILFPALIVALMPIRTFMLGSVFAKEHLAVLDAH